MNHKNNKIIILTSIFILIIDIITKVLINKYLSLKETITIIPNFFYLTYVRNDGIAFSLLEDSRLFIIIMTLIILIMLIYYIYKNKLSKLESISFGLIIGGALGNLIDRIFMGYVTDFIDINIFSYNAPIFNVADIGVVIGVILIFIFSIFKKGSDKDGINRKC